VRSLIYSLFLVSGAAGLMYEVVWMRMLLRILGATVLAYTIVLATFMLGLALGGWYFGRRIDRRGSPLRVYAALEAGIALWALLLPGLLGVAVELFAAAARGLDNALALTHIVRAAFAFLALLLPTTLMGGTLPVLTKFLVQRSRELGHRVGGLYAVNTVGAVLGAGAAGFFLIGRIGEIRTTLIAVALNLVAAGGALLLARAARPSKPAASQADPASPATPEQEFPARLDLPLLGAVALTGFTILGYEVLWTRTGVLLIGSSTYSFSVMLLSFLTGIAVGSAAMAEVLRRWLPSWRARWWTFAVLQIILGLVALVSFALPLPVVGAIVPLWRSLPAAAAWFSGPVPALFLLLAPLTLVSGASFPIAASLCARDVRAVGRGVGAVYLWNTLGAAAGSAVAGLLLLPRFGIAHSFLICVVMNLAAGVALMLALPADSIPRRLRPALVWAAVAAASTALLFFATDGLQTPRTILRKTLERSYRRNLFYKEDVNGIVSVWINPLEQDPWATNKRLYIDIQPMAVAYRYGMVYERLQAHYPLMLHPDPKDVLVICLGTGTTLGSVGPYPVSTIDCVELSPSVVDAGVCFEQENHGILKDPRLTIYLTDGRNYLLSTTKEYDVITAEPMHPHLAGTVNLYTREYFELVQSRLRPGGVCSHWIPANKMRPDEVKAAVQAFREIFPHNLLFLETSDLIILGSDQSLRIDVDRWRELLAQPRISVDLEEVGLSSVPQLLATYITSDAGLDAYVGSTPAVTDDLPTLEFFGSSAVADAARPVNVREIVEHRDPLAGLERHLEGSLTPEEASALATLYPLESEYLLGYADFSAGQWERAAERLRRVLEVAPGDKRAEITLNAIDKATGMTHLPSSPDGRPAPSRSRR